MNNRTIAYAALAGVFLVVLVIGAVVAVSSSGKSQPDVCRSWQDSVVTRGRQLAGEDSGSGRSADQFVARASIELGGRPEGCSIEGLGTRLIEEEKGPEQPSPGSAAAQSRAGGATPAAPTAPVAGGPSAAQLTDECNRWRAAVKNTTDFRAAADGNKLPYSGYLEQTAKDFAAGQPAGCTTAGLG